MDLQLTLKKLVRNYRRQRLRHAINGTQRDRLDYAFNRAYERVIIEMVAFGQSTWSNRDITERAGIIFNRLERIANDQR